MTSNELLAALQQVFRFTPVERVSENASQIKFIGKFPTKEASSNFANAGIRRLLVAARSEGWTFDCSRFYKLVGPADELVWGWRLIFAAQPIQTHLPVMVASVARLAEQSSEEVVVPLAFPGPHRTGPQGGFLAGKGVSTTPGGR